MHIHRWQYSDETININEEYHLISMPNRKPTIKSKYRTCKCGARQELRSVCRKGLLFHFYIDPTRMPKDKTHLQKMEKIFEFIVPVSLIIGLLTTFFIANMIPLITILIILFLSAHLSWKYSMKEYAYLSKEDRGI